MMSTANHRHLAHESAALAKRSELASRAMLLLMLVFGLIAIASFGSLWPPRALADPLGVQGVQ